MIDLQPIKDRLAAATTDYWRWDRTITGLDANGDEEWLILSQDQYTPDAALVGTARSKENAALIAHSREDLTALVVEVERLRDRVQELTDAIGYHRLSVEPENGTPTDEGLWEVLDA